MKKRMIMLILALSVALAGCGGDKAGEAADPKLTKEAQEVTADDKTAQEEASQTTEGEKTESTKEDTEKKGVKEQGNGFKDDFKSTLAYLKKTGGEEISLDYSKKPAYEGRKEKYEADPSYREIEDSLGSFKLTRVRAVRKDNGSRIIADVFRNRESNEIVKIVSTEFGSLRRVSGWYFKDGDIIYEYRYNDDIYGSNKHREEFSLKDDSKEVMDEGYLTFDALKAVPGFARVYGYVGDEFGGVLENVCATIKSSANEYEEQVKTDGDGYYEFYVPVNSEDWYNITFTYGDYTPDSANDISITEGVTEYSCGIMYMAEDGKHVHDTDAYFMNINKEAPDRLKDGEYEAVLTYEKQSALLKSCFMSMSDGKTVMEEKVRFTPNSTEDFRFYVMDEKNYGSNNMAYDMSKCDARVTVYDKDGIAFCFNAPVVHGGVVWEVFEVRYGKIVPVNNYYFETAEGVF